jgi:hypothetical protein
MATAAVATTSRKPARAAGPDGVTVTMLTVAAFLAILAFLASQMRASPARPARRVVVVRRVYETRVVETIVGGSGGGSSVTQSASASPVTALPTAPTTRSS